jgi:hypothetical protein
MTTCSTLKLTSLCSETSILDLDLDLEWDLDTPK